MLPTLDRRAGLLSNRICVYALQGESKLSDQHLPLQHGEAKKLKWEEDVEHHPGAQSPLFCMNAKIICTTEEYGLTVYCCRQKIRKV